MALGAGGGDAGCVVRVRGRLILGKRDVHLVTRIGAERVRAGLVGTNTKLPHPINAATAPMIRTAPSRHPRTGGRFNASHILRIRPAIRSDLGFCVLVSSYKTVRQGVNTAMVPQADFRNGRGSTACGRHYLVGVGVASWLGWRLRLSSSPRLATHTPGMNRCRGSWRA